MTFVSKNVGTALEKPYGEVLQRWRICLASLLFFTIILTDNFGVSSSWSGFSSQFRTPWIPQYFLENQTFSVASNQCLYSSQNLSHGVCNLPKGQKRLEEIRGKHLQFCDAYNIVHLLGNLTDCIVNGSFEQCQDCVDDINELDASIHRLYCEFEVIMARFDCETQYSIKWDCSHCKAAYKNWMCAMMVPYHRGGILIKPCQQFCNLVEERCPYFLPDDAVLYAGEPTFFCADPDIDNLPELLTLLPYGSTECYRPCHLNHELEPHIAYDICINTTNIDAVFSSGHLWNRGKEQWTLHLLLLFLLILRTLHWTDFT